MCGPNGRKPARKTHHHSPALFRVVGDTRSIYLTHATSMTWFSSHAGKRTTIPPPFPKPPVCRPPGESIGVEGIYQTTALLRHAHCMVQGTRPPHSATCTPAPWIGIHPEVIEDTHGFILLIKLRGCKFVNIIIIIS